MSDTTDPVNVLGLGSSDNDIDILGELDYAENTDFDRRV